MKTLILLPHQLHEAYIINTDIHFDQIVVTEWEEQYQRFPYHKKRLLLHKSAVLHFVKTYEDIYPLKHLYIKDIKDIKAFDHKDTYIYQPFDIDDLKMVSNLKNVTYLKDLFLLTSNEDIPLWKKNRAWKMEYFYIFMRHKYHILLDHNQKPLGAKYSFDSENRKPYKKGIQLHNHLTFQADDLTRDIAKEIERDYASNPGSTEGFDYPVTRQDALALLDYVMMYQLKTFGDYQDVMILGQPKVSHTMLSTCMNLGLLSPLEVIHKAIETYEVHLVDLQSVEGFIRQIIGWREYIRLVYVNHPEYHHYNVFQHDKPLPSFYWDAQTDMNCLHEVISETIHSGYNHHIQRLMVLSNYANLIGVHPKALNDWFNTMYVDSFDWVVTPNVMGMGLYADGGLMSTKPYISSAAYIHKMSNYCESCKYDPKIKEGPKACPFNSLYWHFIETHQEDLKSNPRMSMMTQMVSKMDNEQKRIYQKQALEHIKSLEK